MYNNLTKDFFKVYSTVIIENPIQFSPIFVIYLSYINKIFTFFYMAYEKKT